MAIAARQGFTLAEAVISTALLVLVIGGSYMLVSRAQGLIYSARNHYVAINIARARIERSRDFAYSQLPLMAENNIIVDDSGTPAQNGYFRRSTLIATNYIDLGGVLRPGLTKVEVRVDIRNSKTLDFTVTNDYESVATLATEYLQP